jgi:hypothetical protein
LAARGRRSGCQAPHYSLPHPSSLHRTQRPTGPGLRRHLHSARSCACRWTQRNCLGTSDLRRGAPLLAVAHAGRRRHDLGLGEMLSRAYIILAPTIPVSVPTASIPTSSARAKARRRTIRCEQRATCRTAAPPIASPCGDTAKVGMPRSIPVSSPHATRRGVAARRRRPISSNCSTPIQQRPRRRTSLPWRCSPGQNSGTSRSRPSSSRWSCRPLRKLPATALNRFPSSKRLVDQ